MGKLIAHWSPTASHTATATANVLAISSILAVNQPYRSLLTNTLNHQSELDFQFKKSNNVAMFDSGMKALEKLALSNLIQPNSIVDYTEVVYRSRLDYLAGPYNLSSDLLDEKKNEITERIVSNAKQKYEFLWCEVESGLTEETMRLLNFADLIVIHLPQNKFAIEQFFKGEDIKFFNDMQVILVIGDYDTTAALSIRNIKRQFNVKLPLYAIPYSTEYRNALNQQSTINFFSKLNRNQKGDKQHDFYKRLVEINESIFKLVEVESVVDNW